jgi:hypothetical protein
MENYENVEFVVESNNRAFDAIWRVKAECGKGDTGLEKAREKIKELREGSTFSWRIRGYDASNAPVVTIE